MPFQDHPCDHPIIILDGLGWQQVVALLHFMYCGEVVVEEDHLADLLNAATSLSVTGLSHVTSALISSQVQWLLLFSLFTVIWFSVCCSLS